MFVENCDYIFYIDSSYCKECPCYNECFYAYCASNAYYEDQQHPVRPSVPCSILFEKEYADGELPF